MSAGARTKQEADKADARTSQSESQFLADQADQAKAALSEVWSDLKHGLLNSADPRQLTQDHPWSAMGVAAATGLAAAWFLVPSKEDQAIKKLARLQRAMFPRQQKTEHDQNADHSNQDGKSSHSFFNGLGSEIFKTLRPALLSALSAGITAKVSRQNDPNGRPDDSSAEADASSNAS